MQALLSWLAGWPCAPALLLLPTLIGPRDRAPSAWLWGLAGLAAALMVPDPHRVLAAGAGVGAAAGWVLGATRPPLFTAIVALAAAALGLATIDGPPLGGAPGERALTWALSSPVALWSVGAGVGGRLLTRRELVPAMVALLPVALAVERAGRSQTVAAGAVVCVVGGALLAEVHDRAGERGRRALSSLVFAPALIFAVRGPRSPGPYAHPASLPVRAAAQIELHVTDTPLLSSLAVLPDGRVAYGEFASGRIHVLDPGTGESRLLATVPLPTIRGSRANYELGLWGLAAAPDGSVFAMAIHRWDEESADDSARTSRVVRIDPSGVVHGVLEGLPAGPIHAGGALAVDREGALFAAVGDGLSHGPQGDRVGQTPWAGTVLRLPPGWSGAPSDALVHARGFRNIYGLTVAPDGRLWATENGPDCCDALFAVEPGRFHGWPPAAGPAEVAPVWSSGRQRLGPTGIVVLGERYEGYAGDLLFATWHTGALHRVRMAGREVREHEIVTVVPTARPDEGPYAFAGAFTGLAVGPDGSVWFSTVNAVGRLAAIAP